MSSRIAITKRRHVLKCSAKDTEAINSHLESKDSIQRDFLTESLDLREQLKLICIKNVFTKTLMALMKSTSP